MKKLRGPTAGEAEKKIREDTTAIKAYELAEQMCWDIQDQVEKCADAHHNIIEDPFFFVVMQMGDDNVLKTVTRRKFYAYPFLPSPRPDQSVWIYRKPSRTLEFIWALPEPQTMATLSTMKRVAPRYRRMKMWCDWFYSKKFAECVRNHFGQKDWLTESEYLRANHSKFLEALGNKHECIGADATNSADVNIQQVMNSTKASSNKSCMNPLGKH